MESEWEPILLEIVPYKETGTYIMKCGEEVAQQLDDHIVMTQAMSFSPYKKPFEARITTWENKLRTTQVRMCARVVCFHICAYVCVHMCVHVHVCTDVYSVCVHMCVHVHVCTDVYSVCACTCVYRCVQCVCMYMCVQMCTVCVHVHVCTDVYSVCACVCDTVCYS